MLCIHAGNEALAGDEREPGSVTETGLLYKSLLAVRQFVEFSFAECIRLLAEFHLTHIDNGVSSLYDDINLRGWLGVFAPPRIASSGNTIDSKCPLDLRNMSHTDSFKSQPHPCVYFRCVDMMRPIVGLHLGRNGQ